MIYAIVYVLLCVLVPFGAANGRKSIGLLAAVLLALFVFVGFRWQVGCDWYGYLNIFEVTRGLSLEEAIASREAGFTLLNMLLQYFDLDYFYVNVVCALLFFIGLFFFASREQNPMAVVALSFPVLIINMPMSGIRQGVAIGFLMLAINAYADRKRLSYAGAVLAASTFHQSALLFFGLAPLIGWKKTFVTVALALTLTLPALYYFVSSTVGFYAERYATDAGDAAGAPFRAALLTLVGLGFFLFMRRRWRQKYANDYEIFALASAVMITTLPLAFYASIMGDRIGYYLVPFQLVILARIPALFSNDRVAPIYGVAPYLALFVFFLVWMNFSSLFNECYLPYQSVFSPIE